MARNRNTTPGSSISNTSSTAASAHQYQKTILIPDMAI